LSAAVSAPRQNLREVLASPKMLAILILGAASGFPNQITESALQAWLRDAGASLTSIGIMTYVGLPYLLKFLWAPLVDRYAPPFLGRRRGWILLMQMALAAGIALFALQDPRLALAPIAACAVAIVAFSATQDIAIDAYRADVSLPAERGMAAAAANLGYRSAAWIALAVSLVVADHFGWRPAFLILAVVMLLFGVATLYAPSSHNTYQPRSLTESVVQPLKALLGTPGALALLGVVLLFKVGDAFSNKLFTPFMMDVAMGSISLVALIMALCDPRYSAFQYALLSALALLPRYSLGYPAGWVAEHAGWYAYYVASFALAMPGLAMVWLKRREITALDEQQR
jgi:PAT family beta-lactamase induction signal transducer AmpG